MAHCYPHVDPLKVGKPEQPVGPCVAGSSPHEEMENACTVNDYSPWLLVGGGGGKPHHLEYFGIWSTLRQMQRLKPAVKEELMPRLPLF